jgi:hypothetical protein
MSPRTKKKCLTLPASIASKRFPTAFPKVAKAQQVKQAKKILGAQNADKKA